MTQTQWSAGLGKSVTWCFTPSQPRVTLSLKAFHTDFSSPQGWRCAARLLPAQAIVWRERDSVCMTLSGCKDHVTLSGCEDHVTLNGCEDHVTVSGCEDYVTLNGCEDHVTLSGCEGRSHQLLAEMCVDSVRWSQGTVWRDVTMTLSQATRVFLLHLIFLMCGKYFLQKQGS